jgi:UDPglucose--hexose-1-phosphate uridylyltransferase
MSELRQDPTTLDWIIIAKERARRPDDFKRPDSAQRPPVKHSPDCPFCGGNEHLTPRAKAVYKNGEGWDIRVIPNKFAALTPDGDTIRKEWLLFRKTHGYGRHEVIIETPMHNEFIPFMHESHVERLILAYRDRYMALKKDRKIKVIIIFKNHGAGAGTSLEHPHTQIVASPIVPPYIRRKYEVATQHFDNTGRCLHHDSMKAELEDDERIVVSNTHFVVFHPFASHYPFETWIVPKEHKSSFGDISDREAADLAVTLKDVLTKLYMGLGNPDYNMIVHTSPVDDEHKSYYLWHIQIIPRLTMAAGFELGSGIYINTAVPEETAAFMRDFKT